MSSYDVLIAGTDTEGSIKAWLNDATIPAATVVAEAESYIYRRLRVRQMLVSTEGTATTSQASIPTTDSYLETRHLMWTGTDKGHMQQALMEDIVSNYAYDATGGRTTGQPQRYYDEGTALTFDRPTDKAYTYVWNYYKQPAALSTATTTNFLTARHPYLLRCACLMQATQFAKMDERAEWEQRTLLEIAQANREDDRRLRDLDLAVMPG